MIASPKQQTLRRVRKSLGLFSGLEATDAPGAILVGEPRIPTQAHVDGQAGIYAPVILYERAPLDSSEIQIEPSGLRKLGHLAQYEIRNVVSRKVIRKIEYSVLLVRVRHWRSYAQGLSTHM